MKNKKPSVDFEGKKWTVEADHTTASIATQFVRKGVVRTEYVMKCGHPDEIKAFLKDKRYNILYAWNIKTLSRETVNKADHAKYRETATLQAEGLDGEGKKFDINDAAEDGEVGTAVVDTDRKEFERRVKDTVSKLWKKALAKTAVVVGALLLLGALVYRFVKGGGQ